MRTLLLPGYSERNREWAEEIKKELFPDVEVEIHQWEHWSGGNMSVSRETKKVLEKIGKDKVNIIAKSVGTRVLMHLLPETSGQIEKVILCGIPTKFGTEKTRTLYSKGLTLVSPSQIVVFQNEKDPLASYEIIEKFVNSVSSKIEVRKMPRRDHHYPYSKEFAKILS